MNDAYRKVLMLAIVGGAAFWAANFATSLLPLAAEYRAAFSISYLPMILVGSLLGGIIIGCFVSCSLLLFYDRVPTKSAIPKSVILSFAALAVIETVSALFNLNNISDYLMISVALNVPRFLALGVAIGYLYEKLFSKSSSRNWPRSLRAVMDWFQTHIQT